MISCHFCLPVGITHHSLDPVRSVVTKELCCLVSTIIATHKVISVEVPGASPSPGTCP